ncbi:MAG TPA: LysM domain-containing protein [Desulfuromonadaceae bacterium]|jgi:hypothetical protein
MFFPICLNRVLALCAFVGMANATLAHAAMDPRFELDTQALDSKAKHKVKSGKRSNRDHGFKPDDEIGARGVVYKVKPGDHLFKILMRDYKLTSDEAESFVEEIRRENNIYDITRLRVGQKIVIPPVRRKADGGLKFSSAPNSRLNASNSDTSAVAGQAFRIESSAALQLEQDASGTLKNIWNKLIPSGAEMLKPLSLQTATFSLSLDPQRYPVFSAMDGGRILLDQNATIPPLVKSLIEEKDPKIRIVSESPLNSKKLLAAMLGSAGFYSVEENFTMEFGLDPKLVVTSDFKIEKTPESLIKQDVSLLNSGKSALPQPLNEFLRKEGFTVYEPFATLRPLLAPIPSRQIHQINTKRQPEVVEAILKALAIPFDSDRRVDVFAAENNGISLSVKAERFFEQDGQRFIVTSFDGDPITYTLFRLLETKGYRVVILEGQDDFRKVTEKILGRLRIKGDYAQHKLWTDDNQSYSLQMSGFKLDGPGIPGGALFITNLNLDPIIRDLLTENGYTIKAK